MGSEDWIELKFRLADGTDIGPSKYSPSMTVSSLKEKIISQWPKDSEYIPLSVNDVKLITAGKILDNNRTLAESRLPVGVISTVHLLFPPPTLHKKSELQVDPPIKNRCLCTIL
ncbi:membrane-anchored ubiquitin-fold protein 6 isoform X2 [Brassica napus]|uniref:membrane-anchored ubiquitin-fold protein 6 isoform X2 n=1 Tax=Brassica napus TaxID=3708 RepID=UPI0006AB6C6A|nr:membrane-anchored ubiquitin-fold protein 6 isoform X2 [Brassica napus]